MAHLSGDPSLIEAFRAGEDLHRYVGSQVFGVAPEDAAQRMRAALRQHGKRLAADFDNAEVLGERLRIGQDFLWVFGPMNTRILETKDVIWAYPRSKRLEGGKQAWSLVMKTDWGSEAAAKLDSEAAVEKAVAALRSRGFPMTVGFDKEKQKLYKKDLAAFRHRARSGNF